MGNKFILALQLGGFVVALVLLHFMHGLTQATFTAALGVHLVGDILRLKKDGII